MEHWRKFFPLSNPRPEQEKAIEFIIDELYAKDKEFCCAELGTGVGKSAIAITLARWINQNTEHECKSYVLTSQKILQDQYASEFSTYAADIRSSANYACLRIPTQTCADTLRIKHAFKDVADMFDIVPCKECERTSGCPYLVAKERFKDSFLGVTNYSYILSETVYAGTLTPRELLICDESHNIENEVRRWGSVEISETFAQHELKTAFPVDVSDDNAFIMWIAEKYMPAATALKTRTLNKLRLAFKRKRLEQVSKLSQEYTFLDKHVCQVNRYFECLCDNSCDYVIVRDGVKSKRTITMKPLDITAQAKSLLYSLGRKRLLMSATMLDKNVFTRSAGVPSSAAYTSIASPFKASAFNITYSPIGKMSKSDIDNSERALVSKIKSILAMHPNDKGIVHCATYKIAEMIAKIGDRRLLIQRCTDDRDTMLQVHLSTDRPTLIVSPSMMEGLDLKDDLGRLQIVCKVPFPYMGDPVVSIKMQRDPQWYAWCTARTLVQSIGRSVRNASDWTNTYILDECFESFYKRWSKFFPANFSELKFK